MWESIKKYLWLYTKQAFAQIDWRDVAVKAANTFWQAALAVFLVGYQSVIDAIETGDIGVIYTAVIALVVAMLAAGASAVKTSFITFIKAYLSVRKGN